MPLFLGATGEDILTRRGTADFLARLREELYGRMAHLPPGEELAFLRGVDGALGAEIAFEERFGTDFAALLEELDEADTTGRLAASVATAREMVADHFRRRGSIPAFHLLATAAADRGTAAALRLALRWLEENGPGVPASPWCWLALGEAGRCEATLAVPGEFLLVHGAEGADEAALFAGFAGKAVEILAGAGLASQKGAVPSLPAWRGSMAEWRTRITSRAAEGNGDLEGLVRLADLRFVAGDATLAAGMVNLVRAMLAYYQDSLREMARRTAMMPSGFDFFGRLRVERGGEHRGEFDLGLYGVGPLVAAIRVLTVKYDVPETGTVGRIRGLLAGGRIDVELAERLLHAWHVIGRYAVGGLVAREEVKRGAFVAPGTLAERELDELRRGLEAVGSLQKLVYSSFSDEG